jgi:HSP20 family molecular chaperone IbpA
MTDKGSAVSFSHQTYNSYDILESSACPRTIPRTWNYPTNITSITEPTPAEEAALRAKEAEEQAALPYKWTQTITDLDITLEVPGNLKGKDLVVEIKKKKLVVGIKGQEPIINVPLLNPYIKVLRLTLFV